MCNFLIYDRKKYHVVTTVTFRIELCLDFVNVNNSDEVLRTSNSSSADIKP
jgi:hypothetical protein